MNFFSDRFPLCGPQDPRRHLGALPDKRRLRPAAVRLREVLVRGRRGEGADQRRGGGTVAPAPLLLGHAETRAVREAVREQEDRAGQARGA